MCRQDLEELNKKYYKGRVIDIEYEDMSNKECRCNITGEIEFVDGAGGIHIKLSIGITIVVLEINGTLMVIE